MSLLLASELIEVSKWRKWIHTIHDVWLEANLKLPRAAAAIKAECLGIINIPNLVPITIGPICPGQTPEGFMIYEDGGIMLYEGGGFMEYEG